MRLLITDPQHIVADFADVVAVRAEDSSGSFGIMTGHADFLTALEVSVMSWRHADGKIRFCALREGVLIVSGGRKISIITREAHLGDDLDELERVVLAGYRADAERERSGRVAATRLRTQAIRQIVAALRGGSPIGGLQL
jgi:F-type H+-transporting ATPase subunit epsilon